MVESGLFWYRSEPGGTGPGAGWSAQTRQSSRRKVRAPLRAVALSGAIPDLGSSEFILEAVLVAEGRIELPTLGL